MVFPLMRMDYARRRKYALIACFMHGVSALFLSFNEINILLMLPLFSKGITHFVTHPEISGYLIGYFPFILVTVQLFTFAIHGYSIAVFAEQRNSYSRWTPRYLTLLMLILIGSLGCTMINAVITIIFYQKFDNFLANGIAQHMVNFSVSQTDREQMNWLQGFFKCCGVFGYEDWLPLTSKNELIESLLVIKKNQWSHCTANGCYVPHSCCISIQLKCSPQILLRNLTKNDEVGLHKAKEWFYSTGCLEGVKRKLAIVVLVIFSIINLLLQSITLLYSQIAYTSYLMVSRCNGQDSTAILPAWILPFPKPYPQTLIKKCQESLIHGGDFHELIM